MLGNLSMANQSMNNSYVMQQQQQQRPMMQPMVQETSILGELRQPDNNQTMNLDFGEEILPDGQNNM